jgi:hypothetical protein
MVLETLMGCNVAILETSNTHKLFAWNGVKSWLLICAGDCKHTELDQYNGT